MPFPLFQSHLDLAHQYWKELVVPGDQVIDATCGNGHDTLFLTTLALGENAGEVYTLDIQNEALEKAKVRIQAHVPSSYMERIHFIAGCHSKLPEISPKLIVYNLGYLPGGDKSLTTNFETTLLSLSEALRVLLPQGAISIMCYPGHPEGKIEEEKILSFISTLDRWQWNCCHHRWINKQDGPSLLLLQKNEK